MIIEYIRYKIDDAAAEEFEAAYGAAAEPLARSPHCISFELSRCVEERSSYILRIDWDSLDGHLQGFRSSQEFRDFFTHIRPFINNIEEMQHYELTTVVGFGVAAD